MSQAQRVTLDIAGVPIELIARDGVFWSRMMELCSPFAVNDRPLFTIELDLSPSEIYEEEVALLFALHRLESTRELGDGSNDSEWIRWSDEHLWVSLSEELLDFDSPNRPRLLNVFLCAAFNTVWQRQRSGNRDAYLMHGAGIVSRDRGYLFTGASGAGKTTTCRLAGDEHDVLNDETVAITRGETGFEVHGTPFIGAVARRHRGSAPLEGIYSLSHGDEHRLTEPSPRDRFEIVFTQLLNTAPILPTEADRVQSVADRSAFVSELVGALPVLELAFLPEPSVFDVVEKR